MTNPRRPRPPPSRRRREREPESETTFGAEQAYDPWPGQEEGEEDPSHLLEEVRDEQTLIDLPAWRLGLYACFLLVAAVVVALLVAGIITWFGTTRILDVYRFCVEFEGDKVHDAGPAGGDVNATGYGRMIVDTHSRVLEWEFTLVGLASAVTALEIKGPLDPPSVPLVSPSVFKSLSTSNSLNIQFDDMQKLDQHLGLKLVRNSHLFYLLVRTGAHPNGALRASLTSQCRINEKPS